MSPTRKGPWIRHGTLGMTVLLGVCGAAVGCQGNARAGAGAKTGQPVAPHDTVTGTVARVGSTPFARTILRTEGERTEADTAEAGALELTGPYEEELRRLVGARVRVAGPLQGADGTGRVLRAIGYDVVSVDGAESRLGWLRHGEGGRWYLETAAGLTGTAGEEILLRGVPEGLRRSAGAKVWVVVSETGAVQRYGILRPAGEAHGGSS